MIDNLKMYLSNVIVQFLTKLGGGYLLGHGVAADSLWQMSLGVAAVIAGLVGWYLQVQNAKATSNAVQN